MVLALDTKWIWDSWYAHDGKQHHGFFLQADKSLGDPDLRHFNVTQGHAVSDDLTNWTHLGTMFGPAPAPAWDDGTTWTGSVLQDASGLWHLFYTGTTKAEDCMYQRIGHATSTDLHNWARVGDGLCLDLTGPNAKYYEADWAKGFWHDRAMRDPWVMKDPDGTGWIMYFTARAPGIAEANAGGAIGFATSDDLVTWTLQPPVFVGGFGQLEVPQVWNHGDNWYCLFCTSSIHWSKEYTASDAQKPVTGNHYLIGSSPRGPWRVATGGFFDGDEPCRRYAARMVNLQGQLVILGFADKGKENFGGYVTDPQPVDYLPNGLLALRQE